MLRLTTLLLLFAAPPAVHAQHERHAARADSGVTEAAPTHGCAHGTEGHACTHDDASMHAADAAHGAAETPAHAAVRAAVVALFDAMRAGSAEGIRSAFHPAAVLMSVGAGRDGAVRVHREEVEAFATAVGAPRDEVYDERIGDVEVRVDGPLATAWMTYRFYVGERFSHCGVNAFQLADAGDGWKILAITDTRRQDCE